MKRYLIVSVLFIVIVGFALWNILVVPKHGEEITGKDEREVSVVIEAEEIYLIEVEFPNSEIWVITEDDMKQMTREELYRLGSCVALFKMYMYTDDAWGIYRYLITQFQFEKYYEEQL